MNDDKYKIERNVLKQYSPYTNCYYDEKGVKHVCINVPAKFKFHMMEYELLPGIIAYFNMCDFIQRYTNKDPVFKLKNTEELSVFNYMVSGQAQIGVDENKYIPIKENDIFIHTKPTENSLYSFYGKTSFIHIVIIESEIYKHKETYTIEYYKLINKLFLLSKKEENIIFKSENHIKEILEDLKKHTFKDEISQKVYYQIKIIEIITYLYELNIGEIKNDYKTYTDAQIRVVRKIKNHLSRDIASYISLEVLSNSYGINLTTLKNCFRDMYGKPLYTWYREYKFLRAKELIKNTDYPISKIANMIGYKSSSKFTKAFKKEMGVLPSSYRKKKK
ncbi:AraC family transcriptional regulator [Methanosphaera sp. BMS]|uniref:helix-turn-helix domain-containing protein n=1 Tax=Methanosphaera sp. BMS TaxID=1789762 RepID=UPI000DC1F1E4|nr:helix-turn-helix domain-containing protein [Methanosphaera sp. BMS]AWX32742.1 hypothetical protein AW729_06350 [Methanosphaera sp. BMS]